MAAADDPKPALSALLAIAHAADARRALSALLGDELTEVFSHTPVLPYVETLFLPYVRS